MFCVVVCCLLFALPTAICCFLLVCGGVTLRSVMAVSEEHRLGVLENRVWVRIFGRKGQEVRELETTAQCDTSRFVLLSECYQSG
jgi:hypothetical protein